MKSSGHLWLGTQESHPEGSWNRWWIQHLCFPLAFSPHWFYLHDDKRPRDLPFLVPSYPLHSKITFWCINTRKLREQRFSFKFLICYKINALLSECAAHREVSSLKILIQQGSRNGLDLDGKSSHPILLCPALSVCLMSTIDWLFLVLMS